ncbi:MAG: hypothetical protein R3263_00105 [Myxococcota bacterium]|nr:hypothetical protein [Myxococcota bacterium]
MSASSGVLTAHGCRHRLLARGDGAAVSHCSCGRIYLNLGALTLRLDARELAALHATLARAAQALEPGPDPRRLC